MINVLDTIQEKYRNFCVLNSFIGNIPDINVEVFSDTVANLVDRYENPDKYKKEVLVKRYLMVDPLKESMDDLRVKEWRHSVELLA